MTLARAASGPRCKTHRKDPAGWRCQTCKSYLCARCTAEYFALYYCTLCEESAVPVTVPRADKPQLLWVGHALAFPLHRIISILLLALLITITGVVAEAFQPVEQASDTAAGPQSEAAKNIEEAQQFLDKDSPDLGLAAEAAAKKQQAEAKKPELPPLQRAARTFKLVIFALFFLTLIGSTAWRPREVPWGQRFFILIKAAIVTALVAAPGVVYVLFVMGAPSEPPPLKDPFLLGYLGLFWLYWPAALASAIIDISPHRSLNPLVIFDGAFRTGKQYILSLVVVAVMTAVALFFSVTRVKFGQDLGFFNDVFREALVLAAIAAMAHSIGLLIYVRGYAFQWGEPAHYHDRLHPKLKPEGESERHRPKHHLKNSLASTPKKKDKQQKEEKPEDPQVKDLKAKLAGGQSVRALALYESRTEWPADALGDRDLIALGKAAELGKKYDLAEKLYDAAATLKGKRETAALLALVQFYAGPAKQADKARARYQDLLARFPQSQETKQAARLV